MFLRLPIVVFVVLLLGLSTVPLAQGVEENVLSYACLLQMTFRTDSDWSNASIREIGRVMISEYEMFEGEDAPGLSVDAASPSLLSVRKNSYDTTPVELQVRAVVLDPADEVILTITKGHIGKTEIILHKWEERQFKFFTRCVHEGVNWTDPIENPAHFRLSVSELWETKINVELEKLPTDADKLVLAFHYPWYGSPYGPSGTWRHWNGVKEGSIDTSTHFPVFGAYDSRDERLIEAQILLAKYAGIDALISSWWGEDGPKDQTFPRILKTAESLDFKSTVYYESLRDPHQGPALVAHELAYVVENYSNSSAFLRIGGAPVIFVYSVEAYNRGPEFWVEVRRILEESVGKVFLIGDLRTPAYLSVFDGFHIYSELNLSEAQPIYRMFSEQMDIGPDALTFGEALKEIESTGRLVIRRKLTCGTVIPGYDDRKIRDPGAFVDRMGGETFRAYWQVARESDLDCVLITSWNEWHEGTEIEPSVEHGFQYLTETSRSVSEFKNTDLPEYSSKPDLRHVVKMYEDPHTLEVTLQNVGDGHAVAVRVEIDMGKVNAKVVSSLPYPHEDSNIINYIPLTHSGGSFKVNATLSGVTEDSTTVNSLSIRYFSISGEAELSESHDLTFHKIVIETPPRTYVSIANATVTGSETVWQNEGEILELYPTSEIIYTNGNTTRSVFKGWGGDVNSSDKHLTLAISRPLHIKAKWRKQHLVEAYSDYSRVDGVGWYDEGENTTISIRETIVGFLFRQVFRGWHGDYSTTSPTFTIRVDRPTKVVAVWETEIDVLVILIFFVIVVIVALLCLKIRRTRSTSNPSLLFSPNHDESLLLGR